MLKETWLLRQHANEEVNFRRMVDLEPVLTDVASAIEALAGRLTSERPSLPQVQRVAVA